MRPIRVIGEGLTQEEQDRANLLGHQVALADPPDWGDVDRRYYPPRGTNGPAYLVRAFHDRVEVHVIPTVNPIEVLEFEAVPRLRTLVHGCVVNGFIKDGPVTVLDPLQDYKEVPRPQITYPAGGHYPRGFAHYMQESEHSTNWTHLYQTRASMYSGHTREVMQLGLGIGVGSDDEDRAHRMYQPKFRLASNVTDGVVFVPNEYPETELGTPYEAMLPVVIRIDHEDGRVLAGSMLYWDEAIEPLDNLVPEGTPDHYKWMLYASLVEQSYGDDLAGVPISVYGGLPSPEPLFEYPTNMTDARGHEDWKGALEQRIKAGLISEYPLQDIVGKYPACLSMGWAFSYTRPVARQVLIHWKDGYPRSELFELRFSVSRNKAPGPVEASAALISYLSIWVQKGLLDSLATWEKLARLDQTDLAGFNSKAEFVEEVDDSLAKDFRDAEVPKGNRIWSLFVTALVTRSGTLDNPIGGTERWPRVHYKWPQYSGPNAPYCETWRQGPDMRDGLPPVFNIAPVSIFETREGGAILAELACSHGDKGATTVDGEEPPCDCEAYSKTTVTTGARDPYRDACLNVHSRLDPSGPGTRSRYSMTASKATSYYFWSDWLWRLDHGDGGMNIIFLREFKLKQETYTTIQGAIIAPLFDREAIYIGHPSWGSTGGFKDTWYNKVAHAAPWGFLGGHCFPGYWSPPPGYEECGDLEGEGLTRCPAYVYEEGVRHNFPRRVTDPKYTYNDSPCNPLLPSGPVVSQCQNVDELLEGQVSDIVIPEGEHEDLPADLQAEVWAVESLMSSPPDLVKKEKGPDAHISGWWLMLSPDPNTGSVASIAASSNCCGEIAATMQKDILSAETKRYGKAAVEPFKSLSSIIGVGVAIRG